MIINYIVADLHELTENYEMGSLQDIKDFIAGWWNMMEDEEFTPDWDELENAETDEELEAFLSGFGHALFHSREELEEFARDWNK